MNMKMSATGKAAVFGVLLSLAVWTGALAAGDTIEEKLNRTEALARNGRVSIQNVSGTIEVRSWDKAQVQIDAVKVAESSSESRARESLDLVKIQISNEGGLVRIETKYPEGRGFGRNIRVRVNYVLRIPDQASLRVKNVSGDIEAHNIGGDLDIDEVSGDVTIKDAGRSVDGKTVSGDIHLAGAAGEVNLRAVSGSITASAITGSVEAESVSGDIDLRDIREASSVRAKTISGEIECETDILPSGRYSFDALSGGIRLVFPASASFEIDAETFSGRIHTDFPVTMTGKISPKSLHGTVGGGGATLKVKSFSGTVQIRKR